MLATMRFLLLVCLLTSPIAAQQDSTSDDPKALLLQVRKKVMLTVDRLPRYLCTETIDRSTLRAAVAVNSRSCDDASGHRKEPDRNVRLFSADRLRLDVAVSGHREMYSWAGEDRFEDRSLAELVQGGATSTGTFASFLTAIFGTNDADFNYDGETGVEGRALIAFSFRVPLEKSSYHIGAAQLGGNVAYDGTFLVDPKTADLVRMTIRADHLPKELNACADITTLDYGKVRLNNAEFLLPKDVVLQVLYSDGSQLENHTAFSGCHEFRGESSLQFSEVPATEPGAAPATAAKAVPIPPKLPFTVVLTRAIDTSTAAAGDLVKAALASPLKEPHSGVLVPKGAAVTGRITQIRWVYGSPSTSLKLAIRLETIETNGLIQPFNAKLESVVKKPINSSDTSVVRQSLGSFDQMSDPDDQRAGLLEFPGVTRDYVIKRGVEIEGVTATAK